MAKADRTKWDARYSTQSPSAEVSTWLEAWLSTADELMVPKTGRVLDEAGGAGRNALWFARRGFDVTLVDISPVAIELAEQRAKEAGVTLTACAMDLESEPLPSGPWDIILQMHYLDRALFAQYNQLLSRTGLLIIEHPTRANLVRHEKPSAMYLLDDGELPELCHEFVIVSYGEGWNETGKHEARLVARRINGT
ncbi:MAG TPA: methyltransferase domain-containing protein [Polyangium sp.]|nr:methyltransferase domain-containing protein [Polyangium sp.]